MFTAEHESAAKGQSTRSTLEPTRMAISTVCLSGSLEDKLRAAAGAGFQAVEILEHDLVMSPWSPHRVRDEAADLGLVIAAYQPFHVEAVSPTAFQVDLRRAERKFSVLEDLGCGVMVVCSSRSPAGFDDEDLAAEQLYAVADRAEQHGLRIAYEAVPWGRVTTHDQAWRIVQRSNHQSLGLCLDSFHVLSEGGDPATIQSIPGSKVFHVQLADAQRPNMDFREWSLHHRLFPNQGSLDLNGFVSRLLTMGYAGSLTLEVFNDVYQQADPRHTATDAMRSMLALTEMVGMRSKATVHQLKPTASLPPAPDLHGFAFVELAVDDVSGPVLAHALSALGFTHTGQHRSKPVQLWQQGRARVLLNYAALRAMSPSTAAVCALAVESADPEGSARRAERLLAPELPRARRPDEAAMHSVAAPDGTAVFFCNADESDSWPGDFAPTGHTARRAALVTHIDHACFTEKVDDFDQATLFYRALLGLQPHAVTELTAPFGLTHSWTATDPDGNVRISLNTAPLRHGDWAPNVPSPEHIAFAADDIVASAKTMASLGAPLLAIPDNYYDDLDTRVSLPDGLLADMREHSILHDRDEHGEYLHFFSEILGSQVFFEVVQRIDGYAGTGAPSSTTVRMAAHRQQRLLMLADPPWRTDQRHDYSLAHLTALSLSPPELVDAAAAAGYRYVGLRLTKVTPEEPHYPLASDPRLLRNTKTHLAASGIKVLDVELARIAPEDDPREYVRFLDTAAELGARHVITQLPDPDFARKVEHFAQLCELARPMNLTIDLEFPSWTETRDLAEAARVLRSAAQPNAGILVDLLHFARSGSSLAELRELPSEWFHFVHVCDAPAAIPATTEGLIHTARFERAFPGEGGIDAHAILTALPRGIPYALEVPRATLVAQVGGKEHARMAISAARRHLDVGGRDEIGAA
jgi:4-hydroxyphenylpyruvate dioxygenase-like putative hemolysin/sugar phosphate isomerase/epimerase